MHPGVTRSLRLLGMPGRQEDNWGSSQRKVVKIVYRQTTLIPDDNYGTKTIRESRVDGLLLAVVAVGVGAATVAVVDEAGGGHPEGLQDAFESAEQKGSFETGSESGTCTRQWAHALSIPLSIQVAAQHKHRRAQIISANRRSGQLGARVRTRRQE